LLFCRIHLAIW